MLVNNVTSSLLRIEANALSKQVRGQLVVFVGGLAFQVASMNE